MTGATAVQLLLWADDRQDWLLPARAAGGTRSRSAALAATTPRRCRCCATPSGYPNRCSWTDATTDDRFARDPYFADVDRCSLLAVPIL